MSNETTPRVKLAQLAEKLQAQLIGDPSIEITDVKGIETATSADLTFLSAAGHPAALDDCAAAAVIVSAPLQGAKQAQLVVRNVDAALIEALVIFAPPLTPPEPGVHPSAIVHPSAEIAENVSIGPGVVIGPRARIGAGTVIAAGAVIGEETVIGTDCRIDPNVVIYHNCTLGRNVRLQANCTIGSLGFGYRMVDSTPQLIPHNGGVVIEDFVEIGANACVDRAKFGNTLIGAGTKVDNLVQIAHNVVIGKCCLIAAQVGIAGSGRLGDGVVMGGQAGLRDHVAVGDRTQIGGQAGVLRNVGPDEAIVGSPAIDARQQFKQLAMIAKLPKMADQLKNLAKRVESLESEDDKKRG
jgi:UDP-3-O-[3-hydroxymyristoyl] glucosamine N-acyltransferase